MLKNMFDQKKICFIFCNRWGTWIFKIWIDFLVHTFINWEQITLICCFKKRGHGCILFIFFVAFFRRDFPALTLSFSFKDPKIISSRMCLYRTDFFSFLINIHFLEMMFWNVKMRLRELIVILLVPSYRNIFITFVIRRVFASIKGDRIR